MPESRGAVTTDEPAEFVRRAKAADVADATVIALLKHAGWSERRSYDELTAFYAKVIGVAPARRIGGGEPEREGLLYLLNFLTLGTWTTALGQLFFILIEHRFADRVGPPLSSTPIGTLTLSDIAWQLAAIIIAFPLFLLVAGLIEKELRRRPDAATSPVRMTLTCVALILAAIVVIIDGIWCLGAFLSGSLTIRFVLNSLVLLILGGGVFASYINTLRLRTATR